jgi:hypothetical protein
MNTENKEVKGKSHQILGWILAIIGGVFTVFGIFVLIIKILFGEGTDWYLSVLNISVPCWLLGVPLLIIGIRRIKNVGQNENIARKNKKQLIWGWIAAIVGGLLAMLVMDAMFMSIFGEGTDRSSGILTCGVPGLLLGVIFLIIGVRLIKKVRGSGRINSDNIAGKEKKRRIWGWILAIIGGLVILISIGLLSFVYYVMFILSPLKGIVEPYKGYNAVTVIYSFSLLILPLLLIGLSLVILGYIMLRKKEISRQSRGWILNIMGGIYLIATTLSIFYVVMNYSYQVEIGVAFTFWSPFLILGILSLVFGIRDIRHKEKTLPENLSGLDKPQDDVIGEA